MDNGNCVYYIHIDTMENGNCVVRKLNIKWIGNMNHGVKNGLWLMNEECGWNVAQYIHFKGSKCLDSYCTLVPIANGKLIFYYYYDIHVVHVLEFQYFVYGFDANKNKDFLFNIWLDELCESLSIIEKSQEVYLKQNIFRFYCQ